MKNIIVRAENLFNTYDNNPEQAPILQNLDLNIYEGDFTVIMGPSGAGKSTLLYTLSGMDKASSGIIEFCGENISNLSNAKLAAFRRENCGFVFQQMFLLDYMSIMDNILTAGFLKPRKKKNIIEYAKELLESVNINIDMTGKFPNQVSGGELQRCAIVRALINKPKLIFADEPTGALNSANSLAVLNVLSDLSNKGENIIMVTHDIKSALRGNRILFLQDGIIFGECELGKYVENDILRENKLRKFLMDMRW